ncbi:Spy/CpxP family protein refolding chaperone [Neisseria yangbaofengii]|uniref:Spy/CpxP family protein refolding chaperone n=1 Tax=Neisseria yangbaofengii TaxID=2709396 RepID=UPI0013EDAB69|nr:hypothetical protein [Neisseria yangbaofengii]
MHKHGQKMHQKGKLPCGLQALNLGSKQKAQIQKIMEANRPQQTDSRQALYAANRAECQQKIQQCRASEQALITGKNFNEAAARRLINERQAEFEQHAAERKQHMADMEVKRLKERHGIFQVLTAKQQKQLLENRQKRQQERTHRKAQHGQP